MKKNLGTAQQCTRSVVATATSAGRYVKYQSHISSHIADMTDCKNKESCTQKTLPTPNNANLNPKLVEMVIEMLVKHIVPLAAGEFSKRMRLVPFKVSTAQLLRTADEVN